MTNLKLLITAIIFSVNTIFGMDVAVLPSDIWKGAIASQMDMVTMNTFFQTCKQYNKLYGDEVCSMDYYLYENSSVITQSSENLLLNTYVYYSQKNDAKMCTHLMASESNMHKKSRLMFLVAIGYTSGLRQEHVPSNILAYQGKHSLLMMTDYNLFKDNLIAKAMSNDHKYMIKVLIKNKLFINSLFSCEKYTNNSFLHWAIKQNDEDMVKLLIKSGADVNIKGFCDSTPLHEAVRDEKKVSIVQLLINHGADVHAKNVYSFTPMHFACVSAQKILYQHGAWPDCILQ